VGPTSSIAKSMSGVTAAAIVGRSSLIEQHGKGPPKTYAFPSVMDLGERIAQELIDHLERHRKASGASHQQALTNLSDGKISISCKTCQEHLSDTTDAVPVEIRDTVHESFNNMVEQANRKPT